MKIGDDFQRSSMKETIGTTIRTALEAQFSTLSGLMLSKIDVLVDKVTTLEKRQDAMENRIESIAVGIQQEFGSIREEIQE